MAVLYQCDNCGGHSREALDGIGMYSAKEVQYAGYYGLASNFATAQANIASKQIQSLVPVQDLCNLCQQEAQKGWHAGLERAKHSSVIKRAAGA